MNDWPCETNLNFRQEENMLVQKFPEPRSTMVVVVYKHKLQIVNREECLIILFFVEYVYAQVMRL